MTIKDRPKYLKPLILLDDEQIVKFAVYHSREIIKNDDSTIIKEFISLGFIQVFCILLDKFKGTPNLIFECLWCLIDLSTVTTISLEIIKDSSFYLIDTLLDLLNHQSIEIVIHSLWLICNLIMDSDEIRIAVVNTDIVDKLLSLISREKGNEIIKHITRTVALLVKFKTTVTEQQVTNIERILSSFYLTSCRDILVNSFWGFSNIIELGYTGILKNLNDLNILDNILNTKLYEIKEIKVPIVNILNQMILKLSDDEIKKMVNTGLLTLYERYLKDKKESVIQVALSGIANLANRGECCVEYIKENTNILEIVVSQCKNNNYNTKKLAFIALNTCCLKMKIESIIYMLGLGIFMIFKESLKNRKESHISFIILECLDYIFEKGEISKNFQTHNNFIQLFDEICGIDVIRDLESHPNQSVYGESVKLLDKFNLID